MRVCEKILIIWAEEEESQATEKIDLPEAVSKAFAKDYPEMVMTGVETEEIDGVIYYEIESGEGETDIIYLADGTLYAVEQEMAVDDLPQAITDALTAAYPDGEIVEADMITRGELTEFEVVVVIEKENEDIAHEVVVASDGKIVSEEQTVDEEEDDDAPGDVDVDDEEVED
jgi:hypothetical protein